MTRRPLTILLAATLALTAATAPAVAASPFPSRIALPSGWMPEGITAGAGTTIYVGSLAGGGVWRGDVRTGIGDVFVPAWGGAATGVEYEARRTACGSPAARPAPSASTTRRPASCSGRTCSRPRASSTTLSSPKPRCTSRTRSTRGWMSSRSDRTASFPATDAVTTLPLSGITSSRASSTRTASWRRAAGCSSSIRSTGGLFRVDPTTGTATEVSTGGTSVTNGDGLELRGGTLYVVRNSDQLVEVFRLGPRPDVGDATAELTSPDLSVPTTAAVQAGRLWVVNARFGIPTDRLLGRSGPDRLVGGDTDITDRAERSMPAAVSRPWCAVGVR